MTGAIQPLQRHGAWHCPPSTGVLMSLTESARPDTVPGAPATARPRRHGLHHRPPKAPQAAASEPRQSWAIMAIALVAQILVVLDISVVNAALPTIGRSLHLA